MKHYLTSGAACAALALAAATAPLASAQEASIIPNSTVIGENYGYPVDYPTADERESGTIDLLMEAAVFFKNTEIIGLNTLDGETLYGAILPVRANWQPTDFLSLELGVELAQNFGDDDSLKAVEPIIRLVAEPMDNIYVIGGSILPTHWSHQALFDDSNKFRRNVEQGLQFRADLPYWKQDTWLNWRVEEGDIEAEEFELGNATQVRLFQDMLRLDAQVHWTHAGGQISTSPRLENNLVGLVGASAGLQEPFGMQRVSDARIGANYIMSSDDTRLTPKVDGNGYELYAESVVETGQDNVLKLRMSWFEGDDIINRRGDQLYTLDQYGQIGAAHVWRLGDKVNLEVGGIAQQTDDRTNWSANINLTFTGNFVAGFVRAR